jgi:hypothetical protein
MIFLHYESIVSEMDPPAPSEWSDRHQFGPVEPGFTPENALLLNVEGLFR